MFAKNETRGWREPATGKKNNTQGNTSTQTAKSQGFSEKAIDPKILQVVGRGWPVLPIQENGKIPFKGQGLAHATTDQAIICKWVKSAGPRSVLNWATAPPADVLVLDADSSEAADELEQRYPELRTAPKCRTPRGGAHFYLTWPPDTPPPAARTRAMPGLEVDIRGLGKAYLLIPPSKFNGTPYSWERPLTQTLPVVSKLLAAALLAGSRNRAAAIDHTPISNHNPLSPHRPYVEEAIRGEAEKVSLAGHGTRNDTLNVAAFALGQLLHLGTHTEAEVAGRLMVAAEAAGLGSVEAQNTIQSGVVAGRKNPRHVQAGGFHSVTTPMSQDWPDPFPLASKTAPEPYPLDALPETIRAAVEEVQSFVMAPIALVASSALAAISLAIQAHVDVERADRLTGPCSLFLLTIADSGERKSTCDAFFVKPIREYEQQQAEEAKPKLREFRADLEAWEAKRSGFKDKIRMLAKKGDPTEKMVEKLRDLEDEKPEKPRVPRLLYTDATPEALAFGLAKNWPSGGLSSAEAGTVFGSHGMGKDSVMRNLSLLNQLWDGASLAVDRRSTESFTVQGARLTMGLQVQAPTLREFFARAGALARGTGFLARFLVAWPVSTQGKRPYEEPPASWPTLEAFCRRINKILAQRPRIDENGGLTPALLTLTPEAKKVWIKYHDEVESELACGGELYDVRDVASKTADNAARLAALFHAFEYDTSGAIGADSFERASRITKWHLYEARRFLGELALPPEMVDAAKLDAWLIDWCRREQTASVGKNIALQYGPLRKKDTLDAAIRELADLDRLVERREGKKGKTILEINPGVIATAILAISATPERPQEEILFENSKNSKNSDSNLQGADSVSGASLPDGYIEVEI